MDVEQVPTCNVQIQLHPVQVKQKLTDSNLNGSPETGRKLRFGPAMAVRTNVVDLPSVTALFADVSSRGLKRQRRWSPSPASTPTKVGNNLIITQQLL